MTELVYRKSKKAFWLRVALYRWFLWLISLGVIAFIDFRRREIERIILMPNRVRLVVGILAPKERDISYTSITSAKVDPTIPGKLLGYGTVVIKTASEEGTIRFRWIERPHELRDNMWALKDGNLDALSTGIEVGEQNDWK